LRVAVRQDDY